MDVNIFSGAFGLNSRSIAQALGAPPPLVLTPTIVAGQSAKITGDTAEHIAAYINVPGGLMGAKGVIELSPLVEATSVGAGNMLVYLRIVAGTSAGTLAGTALLNGNTLTAVTNRARANYGVYNTAINAQAVLSLAALGFGTASSALATGAIDTASAFTLSLNLRLTAATDSTWLAALDAVLKPRAS